MDNLGIVYLICFQNHFKHARHYLGFAKNDVEKRLEKHRKGQGSKLLRAVASAGIEFDVIRTWSNVDRHFERRLKNMKNTKAMCPLCNPANALKNGLIKQKERQDVRK